MDKAMLRFRRRGRVYRVISMDTPLEELEDFFSGSVGKDGGDGNGSGTGESLSGTPQEFAVVTDARRRFVLGVVTKVDLEEFVKRRPTLA